MAMNGSEMEALLAKLGQKCLTGESPSVKSLLLIDPRARAKLIYSDAFPKTERAAQLRPVTAPLFLCRRVGTLERDGAVVLWGSRVFTFFTICVDNLIGDSNQSVKSNHLNAM